MSARAEPGSPVDLHTHSSRSDGLLAPADLVREAAAAGIELLALTDHDTTGGLEDAALAARAAGIALVPGSEVSALWRCQAIHVLGLWIDPEAPPLKKLLEAQRARRQQRLERMCARLTELGLPGRALLRECVAASATPTRTHLASALVAGGHVRRPEEAFRRYLGAGKPAHVAAGWPSIGEVIACIRGAGGRAALAHPARYRLSAGALRALIAEFGAAGGHALEIVSGASGGMHAEGLGALALRHGLAGSVGSDFHGFDRTWNPLGRLAKLPASISPVWLGAL